MPLTPRAKVSPNPVFQRAAQTGILKLRYGSNDALIDGGSINTLYQDGDFVKLYVKSQSKYSTSFNLNMSLDTAHAIWTELKAGKDCDIREYSGEQAERLKSWPVEEVRAQAPSTGGIFPIFL
jgi:hypothetical protein